MAHRLLSRRLILSSSMLASAVIGYGRRAYAACVPAGGSSFICSGASTGQSISAANADVSTLPGFSVTTASSNALSITGSGDLFYTDTNFSPLTAVAGNGLNMSTNVVAPGSITIHTNGVINTRNYGIRARNIGTGALSITADGDITSAGTTTLSRGISAINFGTDLSVVTGAGVSVTGARYGILGRNYGTGSTTVTVNGDVTASGTTGIDTAIVARGNAGVTLTTATGTTVSGQENGLFLQSSGNGSLNITVNGDVTGTNDDGIYARTGAGGSIAVTVASTSQVTSTGIGADDFAIDTSALGIVNGATNLTVAGTLNGGAGGAVRFHRSSALADRLELHPTAVINGTVFAGPGSDTLALGGIGAGNFDVSQIGPAAQYQDFEVFEKVGASAWTLIGTNASITDWTVNAGVLSVQGMMPNTAFTVDGGTLALGATGDISSVNLNGAASVFDISGTTAGASITSLSGVAGSSVTLGSQTLTLSGAAGTFGGVLAGSGGLTLDGGTETLTGTSTYTGATNINGGTLALASTGSIANSGGVKLNGAASVFDISGTTAGASITSLSGVAGSSVTLGSQTLTLSGAAGTFGGVLAGSGGLTLDGGTETLTGTSTYTGATNINGGTLALASTGSIANSGGVNLNGAASVFNISGTTAGASITSLSGVAGSSVTLGSQTLTLSGAAGTFGGVLAGSGGLTLNGGTETLTGTSTYTGATNINAGTLLVDGSIASSSGVTVNSGGTVGGTGTLPSTAINGGVLSPGTPIGVLNVQGILSFTPTSTYQVSISPSASGRTDVTGTAALSGTALVIAYPGSYPKNSTYTILTAAGGVNGTFSDLSWASDFLCACLSYDANNVYLNITSTGLTFADVGRTANQVATGAAVELLDTGNPIYDVIVLGSAEQARAAFDLLSGEIYASGFGMMLDDSRYVRDAVFGRLRQTYGSGAGSPPTALTGSAAVVNGAADNASSTGLTSTMPPVQKDSVNTTWAQAVGTWGHGGRRKCRRLKALPRRRLQRLRRHL
ncbi:beta strand repeat-containing protein [Ancylobacter novellus]|uniref:beta strand repeat-containing protein n=1 Tax=Ancylobacter novellus TaxID=921 RepID=UPI000307B2C3|nr:hypothetical protein [Ancylobacter novellus]